MKKVIKTQDIDKYINDLPNHSQLAIKIADFVNVHKDYTLAQVGQIIDEFYGESNGLSIAEDIESIF